MSFTGPMVLVGGPASVDGSHFYGLVGEVISFPVLSDEREDYIRCAFRAGNDVRIFYRHESLTLEEACDRLWRTLWAALEESLPLARTGSAGVRQ